MDEERRRHERYPSFKRAELTATDSNGAERTMPILIRDESSSGVGAVYVGEDPPDISDQLVLARADGNPRPVRLVWRRMVADFVSMMGLEVQEE